GSSSGLPVGSTTSRSATARLTVITAFGSSLESGAGGAPMETGSMTVAVAVPVATGCDSGAASENPMTAPVTASASASTHETVGISQRGVVMVVSPSVALSEELVVYRDGLRCTEIARRIPGLHREFDGSAGVVGRRERVLPRTADLRHLGA